MEIGKTRNCVKTLRPPGVVFLVFPISTRVNVDTTIYQHGKLFIFQQILLPECVQTFLFILSTALAGVKCVDEITT